MTGGGQRVTIDTNTPLPELIQRLEGNWREIPTGKAYWFGYTKDMYSIANHGDQAIAPLLGLIEKTESDHAKYGALLTLHLIGIEQRIVGRFMENFTNTKVRETFYDLLRDASVRDQVLALLVRDPWSADVPHLFALLETLNDGECRSLVNALFRYGLANQSFGGTLPPGATTARVFLVGKDSRTELGEIHVFTRERPGEGFGRINKLNSSDKDVIIQSGSTGRTVWKFRDAEKAQARFEECYPKLVLRDEVYTALRGEQEFIFRYCGLYDDFNFQVTDTEVLILSPAAAKVRWLAWWNEQPTQYKERFTARQTKNVTVDSR